MKFIIALFTLLAASSGEFQGLTLFDIKFSVQIDNIHVKLRLSSSVKLLKSLEQHFGNIRRASGTGK